jgi:hypothetical protein
VSFLDNLENNLKALESRDEAGSNDARKRDADRSLARAAAPWAERLRNADFTKKLMQQATRAGFQMRSKVYITWIGSTLRLEGRNQRLELRPASEGISAVILHDGEEVKRTAVDLNGDPDTLLREWLPLVKERKRLDDQAAEAAVEMEEE